MIPENGELPESLKYDYPYVVQFHVIFDRKRKVGDGVSVKQKRLIKLMENRGKIPTLFLEYYPFEFSPQAIPLVSEILLGKQSTMSKDSFEKCYEAYLDFFQHEENSSQNYCLYLSQKKQLKKKSGYFM